MRSHQAVVAFHGNADFGPLRRPRGKGLKPPVDGLKRRVQWRQYLDVYKRQALRLVPLRRPLAARRLPDRVLPVACGARLLGPALLVRAHAAVSYTHLQGELIVRGLRRPH